MVEYVEVDLEDLRIANDLAHDLLGHALDELSRPSRDLLLQLEKMVAERVAKASSEREEYHPQTTDVTFTRREIRAYTGWSNARVHRYLKELVEFEYLLLEAGRNGITCRYRLLHDGQAQSEPHKAFMPGLTSIEEIKRRYKL